MKKFLFYVALTATAVGFVSCGTSKSIAANSSSRYSEEVNNEDINLNLSKTVQNAFDNQAAVSVEMIDFGFGRSGDKAKALRDALKSAQNNIAIRLYRSVSIVDKEFAEDIVLGENITSKSKKSDMIIGIVDRKVSTISYTKAPVFRKDKNIWECDVEVKLSPEVLKSITDEIFNSVSEDDEIKLRYDESKFYEDVYSKQQEEYRNAQK